MPEPRGPYLNFAVLCERVLQEADGVLSFIRLVDQLTQTITILTPEGVGTPPIQSLAPQPVSLTLAVGLKSGGYEDSVPVSVRIEPPSGPTWPEFRTSVRMEGGDKGASILVPIQFPALVEGLYWFSIEVSGEVLTRIPLRITRHIVAQTISPQQG